MRLGHGFLAAEHGIPLFESIFLSMQLDNLVIVDAYIRKWEAEVLSELIESERTPMPGAKILQAFTEMWLFAFYELMRTWFKMKADIVRYAHNAARGRPSAKRRGRERRHDIAKRTEDLLYYRYYESAVTTNEGLIPQLNEAADKLSNLYNRLRLVRVMLAKHEVPNSRGAIHYVAVPARISYDDGSLYWFVETPEANCRVSRRELWADFAAVVFGWEGDGDV